MFLSLSPCSLESCRVVMTREREIFAENLLFSFFGATSLFSFSVWHTFCFFLFSFSRFCVEVGEERVERKKKGLFSVVFLIGSVVNERVEEREEENTQGTLTHVTHPLLFSPTTKTICVSFPRILLIKRRAYLSFCFLLLWRRVAKQKNRSRRFKKIRLWESSLLHHMKTMKRVISTHKKKEGKGGKRRKCSDILESGKHLENSSNGSSSSSRNKFPCSMLPLLHPTATEKQAAAASNQTLHQQHLAEAAITAP